MKPQRGFVLVIVLVVVALLTAMTVTFINEVYLETGANRASVDATQGSLFAEGGISVGRQLLATTLGGKSYSSLNDLWAQPLHLQEEQGQLRLTIIDESGKLNLNLVTLPNGSPHTLYHPIAQRLLKRLNLPADLLDAASDWIDEGDIPTPGGAETVWYLARKQPVKPRNGPLATVEELGRVRGFAGEPLQRLQPFITVYGQASAGAPAAPININTAPKELLEALDERISPLLAERIIAYRRATPFQDPSELARVTGMSEITPSLLTGISVKGSVYRLLSEATVNGTTRTIEAVVRLTGSSTTMLYWREY
jgi:general secretion pathway protein K